MVEQLRIGFLGAGWRSTSAPLERWPPSSTGPAGTLATPDFDDAVEAHRIVDAMYRSAATDGAPVELARV
jgi:predicted dehydrogenase